jgi:hypothetical protein
MNIKIQKISIASIVLVLVLVTSVATPLAFGQTNQSGSIEEKLKASSGMNAMKATAAGDLVFVLICPNNFQSIDDCQVFAGQPINP